MDNPRTDAQLDRRWRALERLKRMERACPGWRANLAAGIARYKAGLHEHDPAARDRAWERWWIDGEWEAVCSPAELQARRPFEVFWGDRQWEGA